MCLAAHAEEIGGLRARRVRRFWAARKRSSRFTSSPAFFRFQLDQTTVSGVIVSILTSAARRRPRSACAARWYHRDRARLFHRVQPLSGSVWPRVHPGGTPRASHRDRSASRDVPRVRRDRRRRVRDPQRPLPMSIERGELRRQSGESVFVAGTAAICSILREADRAALFKGL